MRERAVVLQPIPTRAGPKFPAWPGLCFLLGLAATSAVQIKAASSSVTPAVIERIYFMIHPFCYRGPCPPSPVFGDSPEARRRWDQYVAYENKISQRWFQAIAAMGPKDALFIGVPSSCPKDLREFAEAHLGPRAVVIEDDLRHRSDVWEQLSPSAKLELGEELLAMYRRYGNQWSAEPLGQPVAARGWAERFKQACNQRGLTYDPKTVRAESWGESFEGCVANYGRHLSTYLALAKPIEDDFAMTVPDAPFLLTARFLERIPLAHDVRLYLWEAADGQLVALFQKARAAIGEPALFAEFPLRDWKIEVRSRMDRPMWPKNLPPVKGSAAEGMAILMKNNSAWEQKRQESETTCVEVNGELKVPVPGTFVSDMTYIFVQGVSFADLRAVLANARLVEETKVTAQNYPAPDAAWVNTLGMRFAPVPGTGVLFGVWETRVQDYEVFARATNQEWPKPDFPQGSTHPAVNVSWEDAQAFCRWLTENERATGRLQPKQKYRLPTDAEWSVAVGLEPERGSSPEEKDSKLADAYPWGTQWPPPRGAGNYFDEAATRGHYPGGKAIPGYDDGYDVTSPVGSFAANRFGLHDLSGNVFEWCEDTYSPTNSRRVMRGGAFASAGSRYLLSSNRHINVPGFRFWDYGFRCVVEAAAR